MSVYLIEAKIFSFLLFLGSICNSIYSYYLFIIVITNSFIPAREMYPMGTLVIVSVDKTVLIQLKYQRRGYTF